MCLICGFIYDEAADRPAGHPLASRWGRHPLKLELSWRGARKEDFEDDRKSEGFALTTPSEHTKRQQHGSRRIKVNLSGIKVMVIDDSNTIRRSAEISSLRRDARWCFCRGQLRRARQNRRPRARPDLRGGHHDAAARRLPDLRTHQENTCLKSTPVIMLSSKDGLFDRAWWASPSDYLTKPFTKESLLRPWPATQGK